MSEVINRQELLNRLDNDLELLQDLIELFLEDYPARLQEIEQAVVSQNAAQLCSAAHTLKGSVGNFCAQDAYHAAFVLEKRGRENNFSGAQDDLLRLQSEMKRVGEALQVVARETAS